MHFSLQVLALTASTITLITAQPVEHGRQHKHRRQSWSNPALYAGVDWSKVDYGGGAPAAGVAPPAAHSPNAAPNAEQKNAVKSVTVSAPQPSAQGGQQQQNAPQQNSVAPQIKTAPPRGGATGGSTGGSGKNGGKRGLAYNSKVNSPSLDMFDSYSEITWAYNWGSTPNAPNIWPYQLPSKYQFVPMLWGLNSDHTPQWGTDINQATGPTKYLMAFNEPDKGLDVGGSNIDVGDAVNGFQQYLSPQAAKGFKLGSPAVSNSVDPGQGLDGWLKPFLQQCQDCLIDFVPVHWYGCTNGCVVDQDVSDFKKYVQDAVSVAGSLPIWVTEMQCHGDAATFLGEILPWLDGQQAVQRYSYYMVTNGILVDDNNINALGQKYGQ